MKELFLAMLAKLGITADQQKLIEADLNALPPTLPPPTLPPPNPPTNLSNDSAIEAMIAKALAPLQRDNEQLRKLLGEEALARKEATELIKADNDRKRADEIKTLLDAAVAEGKIPADNAQKRADWQKQLETNFDGAKFALGEIPAAKAPGSNNKSPDGKNVKGVNPATEIDTLRQDAAAAFATT